MSSIFISYRRADAQGEAGRLFDDLSARFSPGSVFMDVATLQPGRDFRKAIRASVSTCSVLLAMIGQQWPDMKDASGTRRLEDPSDLVRLEIAYALSRDIPVVPVLVRGARMPDVEQLPHDMKELPYRNAVELTHARWKSDVDVLIRALVPLLHECGNGSATTPQNTRDRENKAVAMRDHAVTADTISKIDTTIIELVGQELATYIGPISEILVKRMAKQCSRVEELYAMAALEIEKEADRARFLRACTRRHAPPPNAD